MFMKSIRKMLSVAMIISVVTVLFIGKAHANQAAGDTTKVQRPADPPKGFKHQYAMVNGVNIHYVTGGSGEPLLLVHGFGQNWYMWNRLLPELAKHFTVVAPDLRGVGESGKPAGGYDKKNMAVDMHELMKKLGYQHINIAGHDIGMIVAYAYAAQFADDVKKIAFMDALLPGIEPVYSQIKAQAWWFGFFSQPHAGEIVSGKVGLFFTDFWPPLGYQKSAFTEAERNEFIRAYSVPGATTSAFHWFGEFPQDAIDDVEFMKNKLPMPLLAMGSDHFAGSFLADHSRMVANDVHEVLIKDSGHWVVQEQTEQVQKALLDFFLN
jgi:pimeloyl-ACP methyl ester carboxylesterase